MIPIEWSFGNKRRIGQVDEALDFYPAMEFASPERSTVPLISLLKQGGACWSEIVNIATQGHPVCDAFLEYQVRPLKGRGTASHTDLLLLGPQTVVALEAKWTEPAYKSVLDWKGSSQNRHNILEGWLSMIQTKTLESISPAGFDAAIYQSIHRMASACCFPDRTATAAYLQFSEHLKPSKFDYFNSLTETMKELGPSCSMRVVCIDVILEPTSEFQSLRQLKKGLKSTSEAVKSALRGHSLFKFSVSSVREVTCKDVSTGPEV